MSEAQEKKFEPTMVIPVKEPLTRFGRSDSGKHAKINKAVNLAVNNASQLLRVIDERFSRVLLDPETKRHAVAAVTAHVNDVLDNEVQSGSVEYISLIVRDWLHHAGIPLAGVFVAAHSDNPFRGDETKALSPQNMKPPALLGVLLDTFDNKPLKQVAWEAVDGDEELRPLTPSFPFKYVTQLVGDLPSGQVPRLVDLRRDPPGEPVINSKDVLVVLNMPVVDEAKLRNPLLARRDVRLFDERPDFDLLNMSGERKGKAFMMRWVDRRG